MVSAAVWENSPSAQHPSQDMPRSAVKAYKDTEEEEEEEATVD